MNATEIILLLLGIAVFIGSFVIPEQKSKTTESDKRLSTELMKESMEQEISSVRTQIQDMTEETVSYSIEKAERILERLTNEKMQAVNDYSDTVLAEINKNHKEVLFLYDMLNDKQQNIQETVKDVDRVTKTVEDTVKKADKNESDTMIIFDEEDSLEAEEKKAIQKKATVKKTALKTISKPNKEERIGDDLKTLAGKNIVFDNTVNDIDVIVGGENNKNNNQKILELHKSGKSKMTIAKELGLGIGEVKLVIDLFEGM